MYSRPRGMLEQHHPPSGSRPPWLLEAAGGVSGSPDYPLTEAHKTLIRDSTFRNPHSKEISHPRSRENTTTRTSTSGSRPPTRTPPAAIAFTSLTSRGSMSLRTSPSIRGLFFVSLSSKSALIWHPNPSYHSHRSVMTRHSLLPHINTLWGNLRSTFDFARALPDHPAPEGPRRYRSCRVRRMCPGSIWPRVLAWLRDLHHLPHLCLNIRSMPTRGM